MVELMGRSRAFAEAMVTMVCPVLLALALNQPKWKSEVDGLVVPAAMLVIAGATIITGTFPLLACCIANSKRFSMACKRWPPATSTRAAPCSATFLVILACWVAQFIVPLDYVIDIAFLFASSMVIRILTYCWNSSVDQHPQRTKEFHTVLDGSHEFLSGVTGILFLGLEGLALGGLINTRHGIWANMGLINVMFCVVGVFLMCLQMTPPLGLTTIDQIAMFTFKLDAIMAFGIVAVLVAIMWELMKFKGLMFGIIPAIAFTVFVIKVACPRDMRDEEGRGATVSETVVIDIDGPVTMSGANNVTGDNNNTKNHHADAGHNQGTRDNLDEDNQGTSDNQDTDMQGGSDNQGQKYQNISNSQDTDDKSGSDNQGQDNQNIINNQNGENNSGGNIQRQKKQNITNSQDTDNKSGSDNQVQDNQNISNSQNGDNNSGGNIQGEKSQNIGNSQDTDNISGSDNQVQDNQNISNSQNGDNNSGSDNQDQNNQNISNSQNKDNNNDNQDDDPKLAPLGLTKVIFTGFMAISISDDSPNEWTNWFLISAASAIVSGIIWRLMTQVHVRNTLEDPNLDNSAEVTRQKRDYIATVASCANFASFFTHSCIIIATVLFVAGIYGRDLTHMTAPVPAPAPCWI